MNSMKNFAWCKHGICIVFQVMWLLWIGKDIFDGEFWYSFHGYLFQEEEEDGKAVVRGLVHNFLLQITCDHKYGINFYDKTMGTSSK